MIQASGSLSVSLTFALGAKLVLHHFFQGETAFSPFNLNVQDVVQFFSDQAFADTQTNSRWELSHFGSGVEGQNDIHQLSQVQ
jgi:hypothetical protein